MSKSRFRFDTRSFLRHDCGFLSVKCHAALRTRQGASGRPGVRLRRARGELGDFVESGAEGLSISYT